MKRVIGMVLAVMILLMIPAFRRHSPVSSRMVAGGIGLDTHNGKIQLSVQSLDSEPQTITLDGATIGEAVFASPDKTGEILELRQNRLLLIGESTAKTSDLSRLIDYWLRSGTGRMTADVVVCRGTASDWLSADSADNAVALTERSSVMGQGVRCRLLDLARGLIDSGDAVLPLLQTAEDEAVLNGAILFHNRRFADVLTSNQANAISVMTRDAQRFTVVCQTNFGDATVELSDIRLVWNVEPTGDRLKFSATVNARATVVENGGELATSRIVDVAQATMSNRLMDALLITAKRHGSDVCGLINVVKTQMPFAISTENREWEQHLKQADYSVVTSVSVTETGLRN